MITVRDVTPSDHDQVREVNRQAFGRPGEAALVDAVRHVPGCISLVATDDGAIVGHILFTPVRLEGVPAVVRAVGLGPMAVLPAHQRRGVGSRLVQDGVERCRRFCYDVAVVLGHRDFYPRFGFQPASRYGLRSEYAVPDDVFMALTLTPGALDDGGGLVKYLPEFSAV